MTFVWVFRQDHELVLVKSGSLAGSAAMRFREPLALLCAIC